MKDLAKLKVKFNRIDDEKPNHVSVGSALENVVKKMIECEMGCLPVIDSKRIPYGLLTFMT